MTKRTKKRAGPLSKRYEFTIRLARRSAWVTRSTNHTQKREAIRAAHRSLREMGHPAFANVKTQEGALIYQAHLTKVGRIVAEEL